ncbi:GNAT family N-acetyltransferase [Octadecabacter sp. CECT 8868]|uniref:GNAT family N-acetyltransferase n=1 Tax=Octadecabacter algicola TaxID=2909342 RepID=UPI001F29F26E|nr:GNAT family N-acetyltransferase [Octadecabacter algicola]MCF2904985.1 GNAT family N-acetyltransferase [Octadecabacter algicola]
MIEDASADPTFLKSLAAALSADLRGLSDQGVIDSINLVVSSPDGELIAGLAGTTSYGWLRVNMLWVSKNQRRTGIGSDLMQRAMDLSISRGCHSAWLETSNPEACAFYERLGFSQFANLSNDGFPPPIHSRWFLRRSLTGIFADKAGRQNSKSS